jgi:acetylornithine/N-succinyldiaminopimelate aminotransferase
VKFEIAYKEDLQLKSAKEVIRQEKNYILQTYKRQNTVFVRGKGKYLWDSNGKRYLDFFAGLSVCNFGHCHPRIVRAAKAQLDRLVHVSNIYYMPAQVELASRLVKRSFGSGKVFFSNSGAEANECAIKFARKWGNADSRRIRNEIIVFNNSFHGRTLATLAATGQKVFHKGFEPLVKGFKYAEFNDIGSVKKLLSPRTCAIMLEPVQGEGGVYPADRKFLAALRRICDERKLLLIFEEIQCGIGRTGSLFAYQGYGVRPDIITLAKSISNGLPLGATLVAEKYSGLIGAGDHGSTFGGNMVSCSAAVETLNLINAGLLKKISVLGKYFVQKLNSLKGKYPFIREVRGRGYMIGVELDIEGAGIVRACMEKGLVINCTQKKVLRFLPPFVIERTDIDRAVEILDGVFSAVNN